ncbi:hypothetical protein EC973_006542, partial [Apophysomyces ossiformis]
AKVIVGRRALVEVFFCKEEQTTIAINTGIALDGIQYHGAPTVTAEANFLQVHFHDLPMHNDDDDYLITGLSTALTPHGRIVQIRKMVEQKTGVFEGEITVTLDRHARRFCPQRHQPRGNSHKDNIFKVPAKEPTEAELLAAYEKAKEKEEANHEENSLKARRKKKEEDEEITEEFKAASEEDYETRDRQNRIRIGYGLTNSIKERQSIEEQKVEAIFSKYIAVYRRWETVAPL